MNDHLQPRQPKGIPIGGQFATQAHGESGVSLAGSPEPQRMGTTPLLERFFGDAERHDALINRGYVQPTFFAALTDPKSTARRREWWQQTMMASGHDVDGSGYPKMPDNYTPSKRAGRAIGGRSEEQDLRTYRRSFTDDGVTIRMPSKASIKEYSREMGSTIQVPFSAMDESGRAITGNVLVTNNGPGVWSVEPLAIQGVAAAKIAEAIAARLEGRRTSFDPKGTGDLLERHRARLAAEGASVEKTTHNSTWISAVGYNEASGVMFTETSTGRTYGHHVDPATYAAIRDDRSPGAAFNALIKQNKMPRAEVSSCGRCQRVYAVANGHTCSGQRKEPTTGPKHANLVQRQAVEAIAEGASRVRAEATPAAPTPATVSPQGGGGPKAPAGPPADGQ